MDIEEELLNNDESVRMLQIMIDKIKTRTLQILDDAHDAKYEPKPEEARKQALARVSAMADWELSNYKEWRKDFLKRVMDSTLEEYFTF